MIAATTEMTPLIQGFLSAPLKILIDGKWGNTLSEHTFPTFNPARVTCCARCRLGKRKTSIARSRRHGTRLSRDHGER